MSVLRYVVIFIIMVEGEIGKINRHRPFHLYVDGWCYFVTARCLDGVDYFKTDERKELFKMCLKKSSERFGIKIYAWVVVNNHYHLMCHLPNKHERLDTLSPEAKCVNTREADTFCSAQCVNPEIYDARYSLVEFTKKLHRDTSRLINKEDNIKSRQVWYQYWDYCIRNQADFWRHFNYIVQNPLKHGLAKTLYEAFEYPHSSNFIWLKRFGRDGMWESFVHYPVRDWTPIG
ncbi:MAG: transposase [Candidatus Magasanikbacteria bacterium]